MTMRNLTKAIGAPASGGLFVAATALGLVCSTASAQFVMVADSDDDRVMLFDAFDGSLVDADYILLDDLAPFGAAAPFNPIQIGNEVWTNDASRDAIYRTSLDGTTLIDRIGGIGQSGAGFNDTRGVELVGDQLYMVNDGSTNNAPGDDTVVILNAATGAVEGGFALRGEGRDILRVGDELFINNRDGNTTIGDGSDDTIDVYDLDGNYLRTLIDFDNSRQDTPEQMTLSSNGTLLVAHDGGSFTEVDLDGTLLATFSLADIDGIGNFDDPQGIIELGNGNILLTVDNQGVFVVDPIASTASLIIESDPAYVEAVIPAPSSFALLGAAGLLAGRRRRH